MKFTSQKTLITFDDVLMVPNYSEVHSRKNVDISTTVGTLQLKIPVISANMASVTGRKMVLAMQQLGGLGIIHRFMSIYNQVILVKELLETGLVGFSIGVGVDEKERLDATMVNINREHQNSLIMCVDIAHGHCQSMKEIIKYAKEAYPWLSIIAGNVATSEGALDLVSWGADVVKIGVGPGSSCQTREVTGHGIPQLHAINSVAEAFEKHSISNSIIADGGLRKGGDLVKSLAVGASACMLGKLLAGTTESPGEVLYGKYKTFMGSASAEAQQQWKGRIGGIEGVSMKVPYVGSVIEVVEQLCSSIRSGCSYSGASNLSELVSQAVFSYVSPSTKDENKPHGLS